MFRKILVAIDCSSRGKQLFERALSLAKLGQAHLMLLHVINSEANYDSESQSYFLSKRENARKFSQNGQEFKIPSYQDAVAPLVCESQHQKGLNLLRSLTKTATLAGVKAEFGQITGNPGQTICTLAKTWQADLIIIGCRGYSPVQKLMLGSVSNYVTHHAACSVLIFPDALEKNGLSSSPEQVSIYP